MSSGERIIVGISGGVDSAVAALRLLQAGMEVHGLHMTNWAEGDAYCSAAEDYQAARVVCAELGIPLHRVNFTAEYRDRVFGEFLREYKAGRTPNPDVLCNRHIKFGCFLDYALRLGADRIATGHYARLGGDEDRTLLMARDHGKDQTYFLHAVEAEALGRTLFPIGHMTKSEVRRLATDAGLPNHARKDSTGICFIGERPFRDFLARYLDGASGPIVTEDGLELGRHDGLMFYTIGQRSGIGLGGRTGSPELPWYVAQKDPARNALVVVQGRGHPLLWSTRIETLPAFWRSGAAPGAAAPFRGKARIRHRHEPAACQVRIRSDASLEVAFDEPQWAPAPGQYVVLYDGEQCLGGAVISGIDAADATRATSAECVARAAYPL
jgi:tRNA-specific 2-thiouridylase